MPRQFYKSREPSYMFDTLGKAMVRQNVLEENEVKAFLAEASQVISHEGIYEIALRRMIRVCNQRLRERGLKYDRGRMD